MFFKKKTLLAGILILQLFFTNTASADWFNIGNWPSVDEVASQIEQRYHVNTGSVQNLGETMNVSSQKETAPEVMLFFSPSNPVPGKEITAQANPVYFSNSTEQLYYTWYIKHKDCDKDSSVSNGDSNKYCDVDDDGDVDEKDWKIEAMRTIANSGFDTNRADYSQNTDNDGYKARWGGDENTNIPEHCYIQDFSSGTLYEFASGSESTSYGCGAGQVARCVKNTNITCTEDAPNPFDPPIENTYGVCQNTGQAPLCFNTSVVCEGSSLDPTLTPMCVPSGYATPTCTDSNLDSSLCAQVGTPITSCSLNTSNVSNGCNHLFPNAPGDTTGDGTFGLSEEKFWQTNPQDPDTADTGHGDEANVAGLGQDTFTWNYEVGDKVGVVVEGTSIITTKHDDRSYAIMWALPKNDCPIQNASSYRQTIRGYDVTFYTTTTNINDCLEKNLVDPREGGQTGKLGISLDYTPNTPFNDASGDDFGTTLNVFSSLQNPESSKDTIRYEWTVAISRDGTFNPRGYSADEARDTTGGQGWRDITSFLRDNKLIDFTQGNGVDNINIKLNLTNERLADLSTNIATLFPGETGYLKVTARAIEYVSLDEAAREDTASVVIPVTSTDRYISAKGVSVSDGKLSLGDAICEERVDEQTNPLGIGRNLCLVAKNEIIGLTVNNTSNLTDFQWTSNGQPLNCTNDMSSNCSNTSATSTNFLPIIDDSGKTYEVSLTAINAETGKKITVSRTFLIVDPTVKIRSNNRELAWPKYLGYYKGTDGYAYADYSDDEFQGYPGVAPTFSVEFIPSWIQNRAKWEWFFNGNSIAKDILEVGFPLDGSPGDVVSLSVNGFSLEDDAIRTALKTFWDYSVFESTEHTLSHKIDVQTVQGEAEETAMSSPKAFFAAIAKNVSGQILFVVQLFLWVGTLIVLLGGIFALSGWNRR